MYFDYTLATPNNTWVLEKKEYNELTVADRIAMKAIYHDLCVGYTDAYETSEGTLYNDFAEDAKTSYMQNSDLYSEDDVCRISLDTECMILSHIYVTMKGNIIVVAVKPTIDAWSEDGELIDDCQNCEPKLYIVEF